MFLIPSYIKFVYLNSEPYTKMYWDAAFEFKFRNVTQLHALSESQD